MRLLINPTGGMAGDMFAAGLVSAGVDFKLMQQAMLAAAEKLGTAEINLKNTEDGSSQLSIFLDSQRTHLSGSEAREILVELFHHFSIQDKYRTLGLYILDILVKAEKQAHIEFNIFIQGDHHHSHHHVHLSHLQDDEEHSYEHSHDHSHQHAHDLPHQHPHDHSHQHSHDFSHQHPHPHIQDDERFHQAQGFHHSHPHTDRDDAFLHEAQDIVIDIIGAVMGMQMLELETTAELTGPISVGGGHVICSHGKLSIPAPATTVILRNHNLPWQKGPLQRELLTPTGAAILAALHCQLANPQLYPKEKHTTTGYARGTKILDIPPLELQLYRD